MILSIISLLMLIQTINGFYLPGIAPKAYCKSGAETETCKVRIKLFCI